LNLYDFTQDNPTVELVPDFGYLKVETKMSGKQKVNKVKGRGFIWFCFQWLNGDNSDDYKPCELAGVKFGEMAAYKILKDCTTEQEALQAVVDTYKSWYSKEFTYKDWQGKKARLIIKLCWICTSNALE